MKKKKRNQQIRDNNQENSKRFEHEYKVGEKCLAVTTADERKGKLTGFQHRGPYDII